MQRIPTNLNLSKKEYILDSSGVATPVTLNFTLHLLLQPKLFWLNFEMKQVCISCRLEHKQKRRFYTTCPATKQQGHQPSSRLWSTRTHSTHTYSHPVKWGSILNVRYLGLQRRHKSLRVLLFWYITKNLISRLAHTCHLQMCFEEEYAVQLSLSSASAAYSQSDARIDIWSMKHQCAVPRLLPQPKHRRSSSSKSYCSGHSAV